MANFITGREIILGVGKASTWRTAVDVNVANSGVLITSEGFGAKAPKYLPDDSLGNPDILEIIRTTEAITGGNVSGYFRYEGWDVLIAHALGTAGSPVNLSGDAYYNVYSPADNIDGKFVTVAMKKAGTSHGIWEIPSTKVTGFTLNAEVGGLASIRVDMMGNKIETVSPTNTSLTSVTYPDKSNVAKLDTRSKIRMNAQAGAALADGDMIYPYSFELSYSRPFRENYEASYADMSEPVQDGFVVPTLNLTFDKYNLDTFLDAIEADTEYKMDILLEGAVITGAYRYTLRVDIPKIMWLSGAADVGGPGTISHTVQGRPLGVTSAPTGMTGVTDPISLYVVNKRSTDPLA